MGSISVGLRESKQSVSRAEWAELFKGAAQILAARNLSKEAAGQGRISLFSSKADGIRVGVFLSLGIDMTDPRICTTAAKIDPIISKTLEVSPDGLCSVFDSVLKDFKKLSQDLPHKAKALAYCLGIARKVGLTSPDSIAFQLEKLCNESENQKFRGTVGIRLLQEMLKFEGIVFALSGQRVCDLSTPDVVSLQALQPPKKREAA